MTVRSFLGKKKNEVNKDNVKQAKVLDNCNLDGKPGCCLFKALTIETQKAKLFAPVENYIRSE